MTASNPEYEEHPDQLGASDQRIALIYAMRQLGTPITITKLQARAMRLAECPLCWYRRGAELTVWLDEPRQLEYMD